MRNLTKFRKIVQVWSFVAASCLLLSCADDSGKKSRPGAGGKPPVRSIPVEVAQAEVGEAASFYVTTATLTPNSDAQINARTSGVVRDILHEEGDDVAAGAILLQLEDDDQKLRMRQAQLIFENAETEYNRLSKMKSAGVVSPTEWDVANNAYLTAQTEVKLAELALSYTRIAAPFEGRVVWREVDLGAHVSVGDLLFRMMSIKPLLVRVYVPANRIGKVAKGQLVNLDIESAREELQAVVELVSPIVDPTTGTVKVTLRLDEYPVSVRPGDFAEVSMVTDQRDNALLVPSVAVIEERGDHFVFVDNAGIAQRKQVVVGFVVGDQTEIVSGIDNSDRIVVKGQRNLNDGNKLAVIDPNAPEKTAKNGQKPKNRKSQKES